MMLIDCPECGPRDEVEFHYGGQAHVPYPADGGAGLDDTGWAQYLFFRDNTRGAFAERWVHSAGCRRWFNAVRDTVTYQFLAVYRCGDPTPRLPGVEIGRDAPSGAAGRTELDEEQVEQAPAPGAGLASGSIPTTPTTATPTTATPTTTDPTTTAPIAASTSAVLGVGRVNR